MSALELVLALHSLTRWLVLGAASFTEAIALHGCFTGREIAALDRRVTRTLVALTDLQVSLGLTLYFVVSPVARLARAEWSATWLHPTLRFFGLLHPSLAALAAIAAHAAWIGARRAPTAAAHHRRVAVSVGAMLVLLALAIPWPGNEPQRPLLRLP